MTGVLLVIALFALYAVYRKERDRADLRLFAWIQCIGILVQAGVGGGVVLLHLSWNAVGFHYLLSIILVGLMAIFVHRTYSSGTPRVLAAQSTTIRLSYLVAVATAIVVVLGVFATGSGPHSGDARDDILRTGYDAELIYRIHATASYALVLLTIGVLFTADILKERKAFTRWVWALLFAEAFQIAVGITQARMGVPVGLVSIHMVFASVLTAIVVIMLLELKAPAEEESSAVKQRPYADRDNPVPAGQ